MGLAFVIQISGWESSSSQRCAQLSQPGCFLHDFSAGYQEKQHRGECFSQSEMLVSHACRIDLYRLRFPFVHRAEKQPLCIAVLNFNDSVYIPLHWLHSNYSTFASCKGSYFMQSFSVRLFNFLQFSFRNSANLCFICTRPHWPCRFPTSLHLVQLPSSSLFTSLRFCLIPTPVWSWTLSQVMKMCLVLKVPQSGLCISLAWLLCF